jgi:hypothetical protein
LFQAIASSAANAVKDQRYGMLGMSIPLKFIGSTCMPQNA